MTSLSKEKEKTYYSWKFAGGIVDSWYRAEWEWRLNALKKINRVSVYYIIMVRMTQWMLLTQQVWEHLLWGGVQITRTITLWDTLSVLSHRKVLAHSHSFGGHSQKSRCVHAFLSADSQLTAGHSHTYSQLRATFLGTHHMPVHQKSGIIMHHDGALLTCSWVVTWSTVVYLRERANN